MTATIKLNFDRICRACLRETSPMRDLFEVKTTGTMNLHDMIMACASVEVSVEDGLPTNICVDCESDVAIAYKFKQTCEKSDNYLRNYIAERKSVKNTQFIKKEIKEEYIEPEVTLHEIRGADDDTSSIDYNDTDESYESKRFKCNLCNKTLSTAESLRHHKKIHRNIHYLCGYCDKKATRLFDLKRHIGNKHNDGKIQKVFDCKKCLKAFLNEQQLEEHECLYKSEEHQLFGDSYFSDDEQHIKKEIDENKTNEPPPILYTCDVCNKSFKMKKVLSRHKIRVHRTKLHICKTCGKKFPFETALDRHVNHKHKLSFLCPECGRNFTKARYLEKHLDTHRRNPTSHTCEVCNKTFSGLNHLIVHRRTHDKFKNKANNIEVENGKKTVLCSVCGKGCSSRSNLSVHMRRHTGQMSHVCSICSKGYPRSTDLKLHMRSHTGEKPYVCTVCGRAFARADKLRIHTRTHTGEKPYACPCGKAFAQSNDLTKHKRIGKCIFTAPSQGLVTMSEIQRVEMGHGDVVREDARRNTVSTLNLLRLGLN